MLERPSDLYGLQIQILKKRTFELWVTGSPEDELVHNLFREISHEFQKHETASPIA